jgi:hypothetical protein
MRKSGSIAMRCKKNNRSQSDKSPALQAGREDITRRCFLKQMAFISAALACPFPALADPYAPQTAKPSKIAPVRIRGRVMSGTRGIHGVAITDGLSVVATDKDGRFEMTSSSLQAFVHISVPSGYAIPKNDTGTARFYRPIRPSSSGEMEARFDLSPLPESDRRHAFLTLCDPQTQNAYEMNLFHTETVPDILNTLKLVGDRPVFGISCGDIMFDDLTLYPDYERGVSSAGVPFFQVVGNHDLDFGVSDDVSTWTFCSRFGPSYYSFNRGAAHYVVLDNVFWHGQGYIGYLTDSQLAWLARDLALVEPGRPVVVFHHIPGLTSRHLREGEARPSISNTTTNREQLYRLLEPYRAHIISGHTHENEHIFEGGVHEWVQGTVCGAWWSGPICWDGAPNGYGLIEVEGEEVRWRYRATGKDMNHQMRVYPAGSDPGAPDEVVVNIWNWDPEWSVVWYENGVRRGRLSRRVGIDPLSERLHRGPELPERRPWVDPVPTGHLFYAPIDPKATDVKIEATDRFGRVFVEIMG